MAGPTTSTKPSEAHLRHGGEIALHVGAGTVRIERLVDREVAGRAKQDRVPVGLGLPDRLRGDLGIGAGPVLHDHRLAEPLGHLRSDGVAPRISMPPPGGNPITMRTGRLGNVSARAKRETNGETNGAASALRQ